MPGQRVGRILTLRPGGKIGRIARTHVKTALPLPEGAQVGAMGRDVADALLGDSIGQQGAALGLELQRRTGAAVAAVVPLQCHDAAAGAQVGRRLAAFWLAEAGQQQRVRPEPVGRGAVDLCSIIQNFGRMFHRQCADSSQKNNRNCSRNLCKNKKQQTRLNRSAALDALFRQCR